MIHDGRKSFSFSSSKIAVSVYTRESTKCVGGNVGGNSHCAAFFAITKISFCKPTILPGILFQSKIMRKCADDKCFRKKRMRLPETRRSRETHSLLHPEPHLFRMKQALSGFIQDGGIAMKSKIPTTTRTHVARSKPW